MNRIQESLLAIMAGLMLTTLAAMIVGLATMAYEQATSTDGVQRATITAVADVPGIYQVQAGVLDYVIHGESGLQVGDEVFFDKHKGNRIIGRPTRGERQLVP